MRKHSIMTAAVLLACGLTFTSAHADRSMGGSPEAASASSIEELASTRVASGLSLPTTVTHAPDDHSRLFVTEKPGVIKILDRDNDYDVLSTPFLSITNLVGGGTTFGTERGLLGLAFHPEYDQNGYFFVHYTNTSGNNTIARYEVSGNPNVADPNSADVLLTINQPFSNHNGGWIGFGPDGYLYIAVGDGGSGGDPQNHGQNKQTLLGTMLRIDVDNTDPDLNYAIPSDNPFVNDSSGADEIWAYGLRHPWKNSFDRQTGDLYIADVGQDQWEELNFQPADSPGGENYGWRCYEGNASFNLSGCDDPATMEFPFHVYPIFFQPECAVVGGYVYRGEDIPTLDGYYLFGDFCSAKIWTVLFEGDETGDPIEITSQLSPSIEGNNIASVSSFGENAEGEVYVVSHGGSIFRVISDAPVVPENDACEDAIAVAEGETVFDTTNATTTGPDEPDHCDFLNDTQVQSDIWFVHQAQCTGNLTVSLCGSDYATKLAVYGDSCPTQPNEALGCDLVSCDDLRSEVTIETTAGSVHYIRIGGRNAATGEGVMNISCEPVEEPCPGDITGPDDEPDGTVDVFDLLQVISEWGECDDVEDCPADLTGPDEEPDGVVDVFDLLEIIANWGDCP